MCNFNCSNSSNITTTDKILWQNLLEKKVQTNKQKENCLNEKSEI